MTQEAVKEQLNRILGELLVISVHDQQQTGLDEEQQGYIEDAIDALRNCLEEI